MRGLNELCADWLECRELEEKVKELRRSLEDQILLQGASSNPIGEYQIEVNQRPQYKVNADLLDQLAQENGLTDHISTLFRWRPELNLKAWTAADKAITDPLLPAITVTHARPTLTITKLKTEKEI